MRIVYTICIPRYVDDDGLLQITINDSRIIYGTAGDGGLADEREVGARESDGRGVADGL